MESIKKKQRMVYVLTIVTLANLFTSMAFELTSISRVFAVMTTIMLMVITIEKWCNLAKAYIDFRINEKLNGK